MLDMSLSPDLTNTASADPGLDQPGTTCSRYEYTRTTRETGANMTFTPHLRPTAHSGTPWAKGDDTTCHETDLAGRTTLRFEWWNGALWLIDSNDHVVLCD